jgi:hypothetical protein
MPRLNQAAPKYRKHKAAGQAFVEINGRRSGERFVVRRVFR